MKNPLNCVLRFCRNLKARLAQRKASKQNLRWLQSVAQQHQWLDQLRTAGLLQWDVMQRRLFIEADLAVLFMQSADRWTAFIHNTYQWLYYNLAQQTTEDYILQEELKAVRDALGDGSSRDSERSHKNRPLGELSRADIDRIRRNRRAEIMQSDVPTPKVEPFEFFIVRSDATTTAPADQATGRLIAVGHYDPVSQSMEIAPWEEIQPLLQTKA